MSAQIARLLLRSGVPVGDVERALEAATSRRSNLLAVLASDRPDLLDLIERELARAELPSLELVHALPELAARLPEGLCERLGALPVRQDPRSGSVDVAVLDPLDPHVGSELEFHLEASVRLLCVRFDAFDAALKATPGLGPRPSTGPPLPLVQKPRLEPAPLPTDHDEEEPVLSLTRSKPRQPAPLPPLRSSLASLAKSETLEEVLTTLFAGLAPAPAVALVVRGQTYEGRAGSGALDAEAVRGLRLPVGLPSIVETAVRNGHYMGNLPFTPPHAELRALLGSAALAEIYTVPVSVSRRPSLVLVVAVIPELGPSVEATRRVDELCRTAGQALERILVTKKRRGAG